MAEVLGARSARGGIGLPRTTAGGVAAVGRVLGRDEAGSGGLEVVHLIGTNSHWHGHVPLVVGVLIVVGEVDHGTNNQAT